MDLIGLIEPLLTSPEFYPVVFGLAAADVLFPVIPSEGAVIAAGVFAAATGGPNLVLVMGLAAAGAFVGDHIAYGIGRSVLGPRLIRRSARLRKAVDAISRQLDRRGGTLIVTSRFIPGGRTAVTAACGTSRYPLRRFSQAAAVAAVLLGDLLWIDRLHRRDGLHRQPRAGTGGGHGPGVQPVRNGGAGPPFPQAAVSPGRACPSSRSAVRRDDARVLVR